MADTIVTKTHLKRLDREFLASLPIEIPADEFEALLREWHVAELAVFGSVLRDDFGQESDIDLLVRFEPGVIHGLMAQSRFRRMLVQLIGRKVDLAEREGVEASPNWVRRRSILGSAVTMYAGE